VPGRYRLALCYALADGARQINTVSQEFGGLLDYCLGSEGGS
jgi:hypothetical protein